MALRQITLWVVHNHVSFILAMFSLTFKLRKKESPPKMLNCLQTLEGSAYQDDS